MITDPFTLVDGNEVYATLLAFGRGVYASWPVAVLKYFLMVYTAVLAIDTILLLVKHGMGGDVRNTLYGANVPAGEKRRIAVTNTILEKFGFKGENLAEKLASVSDRQIETKDRLLWAHQIRNRIICDSTYEIDRQTAKEVVGVFYHILDVWDIL